LPRETTVVVRGFAGLVIARAVPFLLDIGVLFVILLLLV
jgi:hypothetical protein